MKNCVWKKSVSLLLVVTLVVSLFAILPISASAATATLSSWSLPVKNSDGTSTGTSLTGKVTAVYDSTYVTYSSRSSSSSYKFSWKKGNGDNATVTITNVTQGETPPYVAYLNYRVQGSYEAVASDNQNVEFDGNYIKLNPGASVTFKLKGGNTSNIVSISKTYCYLVEKSVQKKQVTIQGDIRGTVTVAGIGDADVVLSGESLLFDDQVEYGTAVTITAVPDAGNVFFGFYNAITSEWFGGGNNNTFSFVIQDEVSFLALFYDPSKPLFRVGTQHFDNLNDANTAASASETDKTIVLVNSGTIGDATVSQGVDLVIPCESYDEVVWRRPIDSTSVVSPSAFRTLTLEPDATLTVYGRLSVNGKVHGADSNKRNGPTGKVGFIVLSAGSEIVLKENAKMFTWGYVYGPGEVLAESGSFVYEEMVIHDYRGGNSTNDLANLKVFPFTQYYVQNIESCLKLESGSTEYVAAALSAQNATQVQIAEFIGPQGIFRMNDGTTVEKHYDADLDKLIVSINGDAELSSLVIKMGLNADDPPSNITPAMVIDSKNFVLPINNMWINQTAGTLTTHYNVSLMPDSGLVIDDGATVNVSSDSFIYIYDVDDLGDYNYHSNVCALSYSPTLGGSSPRTESAMVDSFVHVNGTLEVFGTLSTTQNGANVTSDNPKIGSDSYGKVIMHNKNVGTYRCGYQVFNRIIGTEEIPLTPAVLKNSNDTYRPTVARNNDDAEFYYVNLPNITDSNGQPLSVWVSSEDPDYFTVQWLDGEYGQEGTHVLQTEQVKNTELAVVEYTGADPYKSPAMVNGHISKFYDFIGWQAGYDVGSMILYYEPRFKETNAIALIWKDNDDDKTEITRTYIRQFDFINSSDIPVEEINAYSVANKTTDTNRYCYAGYSGQLLLAIIPNSSPPSRIDGAPVSFTQNNSYRIGSDTDLTVTWSAVSLNSLYTVTWKNTDGTVLQTKQYFSTQNPVYSGDVPASPDANQVFYGWKLGSTTYEKSAVLPKPTADQTYTAVFKNAITVTWQNPDGSVLASATYPAGITVSGIAYPGELPTKAKDAEYTYKFTGWDYPASTTALNADTAFTAQYTTFKNTYKVTWMNGDTVLDTDTMYYGSTPSYAGANPERENQTFSGWSPELIPVSGDATYTAVFADTQYKFVSQSLTLDGSIGVNFYFDMPELDGQKMRFTFRGETKTVGIAAKEDGAAHYKATWSVDSPQMTDPITAEIVDKDGTVCASKTYRAVDYAATVFNNRETSLVGDAYYLAGTVNGSNYWPKTDQNPGGSIKKEYKFSVNPENPAEYMLIGVELNKGDKIKVIQNSDPILYYPGGTDNDYLVPDDGSYDIYFRSDGQGGEGWHEGCFYVKPSKPLKPLLRAMLGYGAAAQDYLRIKGYAGTINEDSARNYLDVEADDAVISDDLLAAKCPADSTPLSQEFTHDELTSAGLQYYGVSAILDTKTALRLYFKVTNADALAGKSFTFGFHDETATPVVATDDGQYVYFEFANIAAAELNDSVIMKIGGTEVIRYSVMDYLRKALTEANRLCTDDATWNEGKKLQSLVTAIYYYNIAAVKYWPKG